MTAYTLAANATLRDIGNAGIWGVATARTGGDTIDVTDFLTLDDVMSTRMCVYEVVHIGSGKRYVGKTERTLSSRWHAHVVRAGKRGSCAALGGAIVKYGNEAFNVTVLEVCGSKEALNSAEVKWIAELRSTAPNGYNLTTGGDGGYGFTDEVKARIGDASRGRVHSEDTRLKMSKAQKIIQNSPRIKNIKREVFNRTARTPDAIEKRAVKLRGRKHKEEDNVAIAITRMKGRTVQCSNGALYQSRKEASDKTGVSSQSVAQCLAEKCYVTSGLSFWYGSDIWFNGAREKPAKIAPAPSLIKLSRSEAARMRYMNNPELRVQAAERARNQTNRRGSVSARGDV